MIRKLYECGCFDYHKFILDHMKSYSLNSDELIVLIAILDNYPNDKTISDKYFQNISLTKDRIEASLSSLMGRGFYELYIERENNVCIERISLDPFFKKTMDILNVKPESKNDELFLVNQFITTQLNRILTSNEIAIISSLVYNDRYTLSDFKRVCEKLKENSRQINIRTIAQGLAEKEEVKKSKAPKVFKDFFNSIK